MRRLLWIFPALLALLLASSSLRAEGPYLLVRVDATPDVKLLPLLELGLDIVDGVKDQYLDAVCFPEDLSRIRALGYSAEVLIPDMESFYRNRALAEGLAADDMGGYHTWAECEAHLDSIHALYPNITSAPFSIGNTIEGRPMRAIKISDNPGVDEDEAEIFFNGMIHAREAITTAICLELLDQLTSRYATDPTIAGYVNNREIFILPIFNVDGYVYNQQTNPGGGGMWRKNRRLNSGGSYGVDLNRNFGFNWGYNNSGSSPTQTSETYRGTGPFSEPETENVRQFCNSRYFGMAQNFHSYSDLMIYSWSIPPPAWGYTPDNATFLALSQTMQQWTGYEYGPAWEILYEVNGDANDWMYGEQNEKPKTLAWVFEVGASTFWPAPSQIPGLIAENLPAAYFMIDQVVNYQPQPVMLSYAGGVINDAGGNNNGGLDPGESVTFIPDLRNNGWITATGISATLWTADPYITITGATSTFPNLIAHAEAPANTPYALSVSSSCPLEHDAQFGLIWTCSEGYGDTAFFNLIVGDPLYQPLGPDGYGYYAYDEFDENGPTYNWIEVDPQAGGSGTLIPYTVDDQTVQLTLPFTFQYYGQDYTQISVCNNGWVAMGVTTSTDHSNSAIPNSDGPPAMIATFWEDLSPQQLGRVAYYYNSAEHYYIVEFDSVRQYTPITARETFEVVLYDPTYYPTLTGDGQILFQFKNVQDPSSCTVGIENLAQTIGLQVWYNGALDSHMAPLQNETAYLFSTPTSTVNATVTLTPINPPIIIPATGGSFDFIIAIANLGSTQLAGDVWMDLTLPNGLQSAPTLGPVALTMPPGFNI
ncbi:MAG TPA: M14 family metallopeptidase, partial [bacterium]